MDIKRERKKRSRWGWSWRLLVVLLAVAAGFWLGRRTFGELGGLIDSATPHEAYARSLERAGLGDAALGRLWIRAADAALRDAPLLSAPFREEGFLDPARPEAIGYRFRVRAGQRLRLSLDLDPPSNAKVFLDLFRVPADSAAEPVHLESADSAGRSLEYEPSRDADYLLRVQPELLRGGRYVLTALVEPTLSFPVEGHGPSAVQSVFGDPRDGGSRRHHGIDIFAPRGTPVVAATEGLVRSVRTTDIGGRVVWLRDERRAQSIYYAHLDEQLVTSGQRVRPGDTLGLVGNSGNARSTPPHLHFGIYRRGYGPVDPLPYVRPVPATLPPARFAVGPRESRRVAGDGGVLRARPAADAPAVARLEPGTAVQVAAMAGPWLRIRLPDGRQGWLSDDGAERVRPAAASP